MGHGTAEAGMEDEALWTGEQRLWLEGRAAYDALLDPAAVMAFAGVGVLSGAAIARSLEGVPRWSGVDMEGRVLARPAPGLAVLAYRAEAMRPGEPPYRALCSSTWRRDGADWRLVQHQQTPEG
jgi:hypothetical protein